MAAGDIILDPTTGDIALDADGNILTANAAGACPGCCVQSCTYCSACGNGPCGPCEVELTFDGGVCSTGSCFLRDEADNTKWKVFDSVTFPNDIILLFLSGYPCVNNKTFGSCNYRYLTYIDSTVASTFGNPCSLSTVQKGILISSGQLVETSGVTNLTATLNTSIGMRRVTVVVNDDISTKLFEGTFTTPDNEICKYPEEYVINNTIPDCNATIGNLRFYDSVTVDIIVNAESNPVCELCSICFSSYCGDITAKTPNQIALTVSGIPVPSPCVDFLILFDASVNQNSYHCPPVMPGQLETYPIRRVKIVSMSVSPNGMFILDLSAGSIGSRCTWTKSIPVTVSLLLSGYLSNGSSDGCTISANASASLNMVFAMIKDNLGNEQIVFYYTLSTLSLPGFDMEVSFDGFFVSAGDCFYPVLSNTTMVPPGTLNCQSLVIPSIAPGIFAGYGIHSSSNDISYVRLPLTGASVNFCI